jgi:hypothetical protein
MLSMRLEHEHMIEHSRMLTNCADDEGKVGRDAEGVVKGDLGQVSGQVLKQRERKEGGASGAKQD